MARASRSGRRGAVPLDPAGSPAPAALELAQRRADRIAAFREELRELGAAGVLHLDDATLAEVERHHAGVLRDLVRDFDVDVGEREKALSLGMRVVSVLGAVALAVSAFYFFSRIWGLIALPAQVAVLVAAPLLGLVATALVSARDRSGHFGAMAAAFAFACVIADVTILSRILNAPLSPWALLVWGAFALVLAYGHRLRLLLVAGVACLSAFVAALLAHLAGLDWPSFLERPEGFLLFGVAAFVAPDLGAARRYAPFAALYRALGLALLLFPTLVLAVEGQQSYLSAGSSRIEVLYQILGFGLSAAAIGLGIARRSRETVYVGFAFFVAHLYSRLADWWWEKMPRYLFFLVLALTAVAVLLVLKRLRSFMAARDVEARP